MFDETTPGREPIQIVEIQQPFCENTYAATPCNGGLGTVANTNLAQDFSLGVGTYSGVNANLTVISGGVNLAATAPDPQLRQSSYSGAGIATFSGDDFRYVVLRGKWNAGTSIAFLLYWSNAAGQNPGTTQPAAAMNLSSVWRGVQLDSLQSGDEFMAVWDLSDSSTYATMWQGNDIDALRFDIADGSDLDVDIYSIQVCTANPYENRDLTCYNTRFTCQDTANFALGTHLSLYFGKDGILPTLNRSQAQHKDGALLGGGDFAYATTDVDATMPVYLIPSLVSVSTSPTKVNLAGANLDAQGIGNRALCSIVIKDHPHTDRVVDPYVDDRSWNPLDKSRGSFWTRWLIRNKYRRNIVIKVYEGYEGQALDEMNVRTFFLDSITWPDAGGNVTIQAKDVLARLEERKAQAPLASPGLLYTAITDSATSFEVANAVEADYSAAGTLRVGDEIMTYTGRATSTNGITFTGVTRGTDNSTASAHSVDTAVQECLRYTVQRADDIVEDLMTTYAGVDASWLDTAGWAAEFDTYMSFYTLTALITEPTAVSKLISELQQQAMFYLWWNERDSLVKWKSIRGIDAEPPTITDSDNILAGQMKITEKPRERVSQIWVYYNRQDFTKSDDDGTAYKSLYVIADLESETEELYGEKSIRKMFGRWLATDALAQNTASKIITRYVDVPFQCRFSMDAKDRTYWIGETVKIDHYLDVDQYGDRNIRNWTITSAEEKVPGEIIEYVAEDTTLYGRIHYIMAGGTADYPGYDSAPFKNCYIGDANGLLSDGQEAGKVS